MKMTFNGGSGQGRLADAIMDNGKAAERSMVTAMDDSKATLQQDSEATTEQEQEADVMSGDISFKDQ
jgi:hypothetical protein